MSLLPRLLWHMDEPIADTAFVTTYLVSEFARRDVTVILSGVGGDELFGGYRRYLGSHYQRQLERLPGWVRRAATRIAARRLPSDRHSPVLNAMRLARRRFSRRRSCRFEERYRAYVEVFSADEIAADCCKPPADAASDLLAPHLPEATSDDDLNRMLAVDAADAAARRSAAADRQDEHGGVARMPRAVARSRAGRARRAMPGTIKMRGGALKHVMKAALAACLPDDILERKKRGFGTPMGAWLKGELAPLLRELLSEESVAAPGSVPLPGHRATDRRARGESRRRHRSPARADEPRDLGAHLPRLPKRGRRRGRAPRPPPHEDPLRVPPLSVSAEARREDPAVQHDPPPLASSTRSTVASLARSAQEAEEGEGLAKHCAHYDIGMVRDPVQMLRMLARLPTTTPSSMGYFYSPTSREARRASCLASDDST